MKNQGIIKAKEVEVVEAIESNNLFDWEISQGNIFTEDQKEIDNYQLIKNDKTGDVLNIAKNSYTPIYNEEFSNLALQLSDITGLGISKAVDFQGGKKQIVFFEPQEGKVNDVAFSNRIVLGNSHDGSSGVFIGLKNIVYRCTNEFSTASRNGLKVHHTSNLEQNLSRMTNAVNLFKDLDEELKSNFEILMNNKISQKDSERFLYQLNDVKVGEEISTRKSNIIELQHQAMKKEAQELGWTAFTLFNAITYYNTHSLKLKDCELNMISGSAGDRGQKALKLALQYCN